MKVCIIGPFLDGTGYSNAIIEWIVSLHSVGVDVVCKPVKMTNTVGEYPDVLNELMNKDLNNIDCVIQYNLPSTFLKIGSALTIGSYAYETTDIPMNGWLNNINLMDGIIVPCYLQKEVILEQSNLNEDQVKFIPHSCDTDIYNKEYPKPDIDLPKNCLKFYTIAEFSKRKNITGLILAYLNAFTSYENVALIIKTHGNNSIELNNTIQGIIGNIKKECKKFNSPDRYPKIIITTEKVSNDEIQGLHQYGDVFVSTSHGEAWSLPTVDALGHGKGIIAPSFGAFQDHFDLIEGHPKRFNPIGYTIKHKLSKCFGSDNDPSLYTAHEMWCNPDCTHLSSIMQYVYNTHERASTKEGLSAVGSVYKQTRKDIIKQKYSREVIGMKLKNCIQEMLNARTS